MKKTVLSLLCALLLAPAAARGEDVLVIEMDGSAYTHNAPSVSVWKSNAKTLTRRFKGKSRSYALSAADTVPSADEFISGRNGRGFILLRYGDEDSFRKLLFDAEEPQIFVAAADDVPGVLELRRKYGVSLRVTQNAFETAFPAAAPLNASDLKNASQKTIFLVPAAGKNSAARYYVFENGELVRELPDEKAYTAYLDELSAANKAFTARREQQRQEQEAARQKALREKEEQKRREADAWRRARVEGGTLNQYLYAPRLIKGHALEKRNAQNKTQTEPAK